MKKRKIIHILLLIILLLNISSCKNAEKEESENIVDYEITEGTVDGYKFTETEEETDRVKIQMENGDIMLVVLSNKDAPITIANFKKLVSEHFYDGLTFHRIVENFVIQTGDPTGTGYGGSEETITGEFSANGIENSMSHTRGVLSMARNSYDMDSASSQFFIVLSDDYTTTLDGSYASFGRVFAGLDVLDSIASVEVEDETPVDPPVIRSIRFVTVENTNK